MNEPPGHKKVWLALDAGFLLALALALACVILVDDGTSATNWNSSASLIEKHPGLVPREPETTDSLQAAVPSTTDTPVNSRVSARDDAKPSVSSLKEQTEQDTVADRPSVAQKRSTEPSFPAQGRLKLDADSLRLHQKAREARNKAKLDVPAKVQFFETETEAESVVFVVDCSGSMEGSRIRRTRAELVQSILDLETRQSFFVCFFNNGPIAMFQRRASGFLAFLGGQAAQGKALSSLVEATGSMKLGVFKWTQSIQAGGGTNPEPALRLAAEMNPDVIYLLSDGEFSPISRRTFQELESQSIRVHTLAFEDESGAVVLKAISNRTGGIYRFIAPGGPIPDSERTFISRLTSELIDQLTEPDEEQRQQARNGLIDVAGGTDFGPEPGAAPDEVATSVSRWIHWWAENLLAKALVEGPEDELLNGLDSPDAVRRLAAVLACNQRGLDVPGKLISLLQDPELQIREAAHTGLLELADGRDYGPTDLSDDRQIAKASAAWDAWARYRALKPELSKVPLRELQGKLDSSDIATRWAAAAVLSELDVRSRNEDLVAIALIGGLDDPNEHVIQELRRGLVRLADGEDHGPLIDASPDERQKAIRQWKAWRLQKLDARAASKFKQAGFLYETGKKKAARKWMRDIIDEFPGTPTAEKAGKFIQAH